MNLLGLLLSPNSLEPLTALSWNGKQKLKRHVAITRSWSVDMEQGGLVVSAQVGEIQYRNILTILRQNCTKLLASGFDLIRFLDSSVMTVNSGALRVYMTMTWLLGDLLRTLGGFSRATLLMVDTSLVACFKSWSKVGANEKETVKQIFTYRYHLGIQHS